MSCMLIDSSMCPTLRIGQFPLLYTWAMNQNPCVLHFGSPTVSTYTWGMYQYPCVLILYGSTRPGLQYLNLYTRAYLFSGA